MIKRGKKDIYAIVLKTLMSISAFLYLIIFIEEITPPYSEPLIGVSMVLYLFCVFLTGYYFTLKNDFFASGIFIIIWYVLMLLVGFFLWTDAGMVIGLGFPVFIFGILLLIEGIIKKYKPKEKKKKK